MFKCTSAIQDIALGKIFPVNHLWLTPILLKECVGNTPSNSPSLTWKNMCVFEGVISANVKSCNFIHYYESLYLFTYFQTLENCKGHERCKLRF